MKTCMCKNRRRRYCKGSQIAELGPALWLVFIMFCFPLIGLCAIGTRYIFLLNAARLAASSASQASSFQADISPTQPSAVNTANQVATQAAAAFSGITLQNTTTYLVTCPLSSAGAAARQTTKLRTPADTSQNCYSVEVVLLARLQPLISSGSFFGNVPGLNAPITLSARSDVAFENTQGLTL